MASFHFKTLRTRNSSCSTVSINKMTIALNIQDAANILFGFGYDESKPLCFGGKWMESDAKVEPKACVNTFRHLLSVSTYIETW